MNPLLGRWISADPLAVHAPGQADLNLYAYVRGYVLKSVDPLGLDTVMITDSVSEEFAQQWKKSVYGRTSDGKMIRTEWEKGQRHVVEVSDQATPEEMKAKMQKAAEKAGEGGKVILSVGHGGADEDGAMVDLAPGQTQAEHPHRLDSSELAMARQQEEGTSNGSAKVSSGSTKTTDLLKAYGEVLRSEGVERLEMLTCRVGADAEFTQDIADHTGLRVEAHKQKVGFGTDEAGNA